MNTKGSIARNKLSPLNAWAFSFACMIGWAAFVMPATTFLPVGGILGSSLAFLAAGAAMVIIALNYHYLSNLYPSMSGIYNLVKVSGNRRQAFTASWAMGLAHLCCIPLNARALGMLVRTILEEFLHIEFRAYFFQSNTLLVEAAVVVGALLLFGFINVRGMHQTAMVQTVGAIVLLAGIVIILVASVFTAGDTALSLSPAYYPGTGPRHAFMSIFIMTPWAFVGFDSLSNATTELNFPLKKLGKIMVISVLCGTFAYMANIFSALLGMPDSFSSWPEYVDRLRGMSGVAGYPVAMAARKAMGKIGTLIFFASCISATLTGLVGFFASISRLIFQMANDGALPASLGRTHRRYGTPVGAVKLVVIMALLLSLMRSAFDYIEELASVATAVGFGYCSLAALLNAVQNEDKRYVFTGAVGMLLCLVWIFFQIVPVGGLSSAISEEAMICVIAWVFIGIVLYVLNGKSVAKQ